MIRVVLILVIVFILLTILRSVIKRFRLNPPPQNIKKDSDTRNIVNNSIDEISDAKIEEII